jgi:hypothetical protein
LTTPCRTAQDSMNSLVTFFALSALIVLFAAQPFSGSFIRTKSGCGSLSRSRRMVELSKHPTPGVSEA